MAGENKPDLKEESQSVTLPCVMSGDRETLTVRALGDFGVQFIFGDEASVIVHGADLLRVSAILDQQIANRRAVT